MSLGRVEAYLYTSGESGVLDATQRLTVVEQTGPVTVHAVLPAPARLSDAIATLEAALNASALNNTYALTWDAAAQAVKIARTAGVSTFTPTAQGDLWRAFGWASATPATAVTSYTPTGPSRARFDGLRVGAPPIREGSRVDLTRYAHGRSEVLAFGNHDLFSVVLYLPAGTTASAFVESYCTAGRLRIWQDQTLGGAWTPTYEEGYLDGFVVAVSELETIGVSEQWVRLRMLLAVPR